ncbi:hypothetical protein F8M41_006911 [Gigaspora margarita]|uniref:Uncharacterized protein n=1 Tax=Gigaspora margarita TaxID=4874 RepID=A0A8H4A3Q1_GIGMA|nr:hypothetical protein F8M41_006911 [Gigaspora margarita]
MTSSNRGGSANLQQQLQRSYTRQERRNDRLYNKPLLIKQIKGYIRIFRNQKHNVPKEDDFIFEEKIIYFNRLKEIAKASKKDDLLIFQLIHSDFNYAKKESDDEIKRNNFRLSESRYKSVIVQYETVLKERDIKETNLLLQIELHRNSIVLLKSWLGIVLVEDDVTDSDTDSSHLL